MPYSKPPSCIFLVILRSLDTVFDGTICALVVAVLVSLSRLQCGFHCNIIKARIVTAVAMEFFILIVVIGAVIVFVVRIALFTLNDFVAFECSVLISVVRIVLYFRSSLVVVLIISFR